MRGLLIKDPVPGRPGQKSIKFIYKQKRFKK